LGILSLDQQGAVWSTRPQSADLPEQKLKFALQDHFKVIRLSDVGRSGPRGANQTSINSLSVFGARQLRREPGAIQALGQNPRTCESLGRGVLVLVLDANRHEDIGCKAHPGWASGVIPVSESETALAAEPKAVDLIFSVVQGRLQPGGSECTEAAFTGLECRSQGQFGIVNRQPVKDTCQRRI
jgi:hypothetical protein